MIDHNHFICHLILGTFTEYPSEDEQLPERDCRPVFDKEEPDYTHC